MEGKEEVTINGYTTFSKNRMNKKGRGLAIMVKNEWVTKMVEVTNARTKMKTYL